jgi:hypothetical protein
MTTASGWPPSLPPSSPYALNGNGMIGEIRERLATLEADYRNASEILKDRARAQAERMSGIDARLTVGDERMNKLERQVQILELETKRQAQTAAELGALRDRFTAFELRRATNLAWLQYAGAAVIFALTASGRLDVESGVSAVLKLLGVG